MDFTVLVLCLFFLHCQAEGDVREETLSVKTGTDLLLDVGEHVTLKEDDFLFWKFNSKVTIVRLTHTNKIKPNQIYAGRAELFPQNQSLVLKNVQKTDSGEYKAEVIGDTNRVLVKHQVTVLDPVSDVKLEVKQCSSDRSDLTVTCTTLDGLLSSTFICENTTCSQDGGEKNIPPGASMKVYLKNGSVTCNHSNQVSSKEDTKTVEELCRIKDDKDPGESAPYNAFETHGPIIYTVVTFIILGVLCGPAAVFCCRHRQQRRTGRWENTGTAELQALQGDTHQEQGPRNGAQGQTLYAEVTMASRGDLHSGPGPSNDAQVESTGTTIYSTVAAAHMAAPTEPAMETQPENQYSTVDITAKS